MADFEDADEPQVYALTSLTREAGSTRRVVVLGFDAPLRGVVITMTALAIAAVPTALAWLLVGPAALTVTALVVVAVFVLVERRTRSGLQLRTYQAMADQRSERIGQFICCGRRVYPNQGGFGFIRRASMPTPWRRPSRASADRLFRPDMPATSARRPGPATTDPDHHPDHERRAYPTRGRVARRRRSRSDPFAQVAGMRRLPVAGAVVTREWS